MRPVAVLGIDKGYMKTDQKTEHTPGWWIAVEDMVRTAEKTTEHSKLVARASGDTDQQAEANARLIAASPELLDACESVLGFICHNLPASAWQDQPWLQPARSAIAKARGQ